MLIVPPRLAYLQTAKGLCIGDGSVVEGAILASKWNAPEQKGTTPRTQGKRQTLLEHTVAVMDGTYQRLKERGAYRDTLIKVLRSLEPDKNAENLADLIAELAKVAAALHDLGKADERWQQRAREIDSCCSSQLIGRTALTTRRMGIPHTPPCYAAVVHTCQMLLGKSNGATHLVRGLALAAARHHSSLLNPASVEYQFNPHSDAAQFIVALLETVNAPEPIRQRVNEIVEAAKTKPTADQVPLMLPNDDLFPVYALVGRAILLADREDAKGRPIEQWRITS